MTITYDRTRSLLETKDFLQELQDPKLKPRVPKRRRHYTHQYLHA